MKTIKVVILLAVLMLPVTVDAQSFEQFSASRETISQPSNQNILNIFNPLGSGKTLQLEYLHATAYNQPANFDIRISQTAGSVCNRIIQAVPAKLDPAITSVATINAECATPPQCYPALCDGPYRQFAVKDTILDLSGVILPPGRGLMVKVDDPAMSGSVNWHLVWKE